MKKKSCEECKHFWCETYGDNWHEPRETEFGCSMEDKDETILEKHLDEEETTCPYYDAGDCDVCCEPIGKGYVFWVSGLYSDFKCCSQKCQQVKKDNIAFI